MSSPHNVYLTGFMGSGKSTIGPRLARVLGLRYVDLDAEIVRLAGMSIPDIFAAEGEAGFRAREREALHAAVGEAAVVSLGGGALADSENLRFARESGTVVYLRASARALAERLERGRRNRPMLQDESGQQLTGEALRARIALLLEQRTAYYEQAHVTIDTSGRSVGDVVEALARRLNKAAPDPEP